MNSRPGATRKWTDHLTVTSRQRSAKNLPACAMNDIKSYDYLKTARYYFNHFDIPSMAARYSLPLSLKPATTMTRRLDFNLMPEYYRWKGVAILLWKSGRYLVYYVRILDRRYVRSCPSGISTVFYFDGRPISSSCQPARRPVMEGGSVLFIKGVLW